ncbi:MAG: ABC transporter permease [Treponema sp.]|jgi:simple sugar transport system permease protein|nr:ABC transporter permease [Treponema sp.]
MKYRGSTIKVLTIISGPVFGAIITLGTAILLTMILIMVNAPVPFKTLRAFFIGPWGSPWFFGNTLDSIGLLLTASLGVVIAFRGGCFNLGGEGQIYLGGLAASVVLLGGQAGGGADPFGMCCLAGLAALVAGGAMGALTGILKKWSGANEIITSFLLSAALSPMADYLISGPLRDHSGNLLAMPGVPQNRLLLRLLPPSNLSVSFIFALILVTGGYLFINRTVWGYRFRIAGSAPAFARYGGIDPAGCWVPALAVSGALGGLTGFFAVAGTYGRCHLGFPGGLGWNAIAVALIARNRPLALFPAALVYGALKAGSESALLATGLSFETSAFIQAAVLILATVNFAGLLILKPRIPHSRKERESAIVPVRTLRDNQRKALL